MTRSSTCRCEEDVQEPRPAFALRSCIPHDSTLLPSGESGVGWGEPQANPNTGTFTRLATLGFASLTPTYAGDAGCNAALRPNPHRLPAPSPGGRRIRPEKLRQNAPLKRAPVLEHPLGNGTLKHALRKRTVVSCRPRLIRLPQPPTAPSSRVASSGSKAISFVLLFLWASKEKVTRAPAGVRNARCISGPFAITRKPSDTVTGSRPTPG